MSEKTGDPTAVRVVLYGTGEVADDLEKSIRRKRVALARRPPGQGMKPNALVMAVSWGATFDPEIYSGEDQIRNAIAGLPTPSTSLEKPQRPRPTQSGPRRSRRRGGRGFK